MEQENNTTTDSTANVAAAETAVDVTDFEVGSLPKSYIDKIASQFETETTVESQKDAESASDHDEASEQYQANESTEESQTKEASSGSSTNEEAVTNTQEILTLAHREKELRQKEEQLEARAKELATKDFETRSAELRRLATSDPGKLFAELGVPEEQRVAFAELVFYETLGDDAPDSYKQRTEQLKRERELAELKARQDEQERYHQEREAMAKYQEYVGGLHGYLAAAKPESLPYLCANFSADPDATRQDMVQVAERLYEATKEVPSPEDVAREAESLLETYFSRYKHLMVAQPTPEPEKSPPTKPVPTISSTSSKGSTPPPAEYSEEDRDYYLRKTMRLLD